MLNRFMSDAESWYTQGNNLMMQEKSEDAITAYSKATDLDPTHVSAWNNKGIALFRLKRYQDAIDCYDNALELNPNHANAWYNKAKALRGLGQTFLDKANEDRVSAAKLINQSLPIFESADKCYSKGEFLSGNAP
ncbi:MAG: tetratricopeptide repeat protein [Thaumarchaeota archaeon]|nr:tetratricopeptide repeat protein [Nitrososphaerota archaeon]